MATGVSKKQALNWEEDIAHDLDHASLGRHIDIDIPQALMSYMAQLRTRDWQSRRKDYLAEVLQKQPDVDEARDKDLEDKWKAIDSDFECSTFAFPKLLKQDTAQTCNVKLWKRRQSVAAFRKARAVQACDFHGFMDLPAEIRLMIYRFALVKGKIVVPNDPSDEPTANGMPMLRYWLCKTSDRCGKMYQRYEGLGYNLEDWNNRRPIITLVSPGQYQFRWERRGFGLISGVSRAIQLEATPVFFGENQLIFPAGDFQRPRGFSGAPRSCLVDRMSYAGLARNVSYTFDMRDDLMTDHQVRYESEDPGPLELDDGDTTAENYRLMAHSLKLACVQECAWRDKLYAIKAMTLDRLQICLEDCYCPVGCCRLAEWVCDQFCRIDRHSQDPADRYDNYFEPFQTRPPRVIEIQGWTNRDELATLKKKMKLFQQRLQGHEVEIRFVGKSKRILLADEWRESGYGADAENLEQAE